MSNELSLEMVLVPKSKVSNKFDAQDILVTNSIFPVEKRH